MDVWDPEEDEVAPIKFNDGDVYYDPRTNAFFQLRWMRDDYIIISDFCKYYRDSKSTTSTQMMPNEYLKGCKKVINLDDLEEAEYSKSIRAYKTKDRKMLPGGKESTK